MKRERAGTRGEKVVRAKRWAHEESKMAVLSTRIRKGMPASKFGLPGSRKYPMEDRKHAANAKARATQQVEKGNLSPASAAKIRAKANRVLGERAGTRGEKGKTS
jgi:hypothetical protein